VKIKRNIKLLMKVMGNMWMIMMDQYT